jgi:phage tail-like protein
MSIDPLQIEVPGLIDLSLSKARERLSESGLRLGEVTYHEHKEKEEGVVLTQEPEPGFLLNQGEVVHLAVMRRSYLQYLPAIYHQEDVRDRNLLEEFLQIPQHIFSGLEDKLDQIYTYFNPYRAPLEFLPWLASWLDLILDESWREEKKRNLIKIAIELYKWRGTAKGLKYLLDWFAEVGVEIKEWSWPSGLIIGKHSAVGIDTNLMEEVDTAHSFIVEWGPKWAPIWEYTSIKEKSIEEERRNNLIKKIRALIDAQKPAHTRCYFKIKIPREERPKLFPVVIEFHSTLGWDCYVG